MNLGGILRQRGSYEAVQRLVKNCNEVIEAMVKKFMERQQPQQKLKILEEEQEYLLSMKKQLDPEQLKLKEQLEKEVKEYSNSSCNPKLLNTNFNRYKNNQRFLDGTRAIAINTIAFSSARPN